MAGILESLFDNGGWQQMLGIGQANAAPAAPPPEPPPEVMKQAGPGFSPNSAFDAGGGGGPLSFTDRAQPVQAAIAGGDMDPQGMNFTSFAPAQLSQPWGGGGMGLPPAGTTPPSWGGVGGQPGLPPVNAGGSPAGLPLSPQGATPMPPLTALNSGPPTMSPGGGLMAALGLGSPAGRQSALAGVGRGMSAVGAMRSGAPKGAAFATGFGGGIQGQQAKEHEQTEAALKAKKEAFTEDLETKKYGISDLNAAIRLRQQQMQIPWWEARAQVLQAAKGQASSKTAWQMSDPGKYHLVDNEVAGHRKGLEALYREELKQATINGEDEKLAKIRKLIKDETDKVREEKYKIYGLDPGKRDAAIKRGFEGTEEQIKFLPPGTRFYDAKAGVTRVRGSDKDNAPIGADATAAAMTPPAASTEEVD